MARHLSHLEETLVVATAILENMQLAQHFLRDCVVRLELAEELENALRENALDISQSTGAIKAIAARARSLSIRLDNEINLVRHL